MLPSALAPATISSYKRAWARFHKFAITFSLPITLPISVQHLSCFMMALVNEGCSATSISSLLSALSYFHKVQGCHDPTHAFLIRQLVTAVHKIRPSVDSREPITEPLLFKMFDQIPRFGLPVYETVLFQALFLFAFYFGLRVGEYTASRHNIQRHQVLISNNEIKLTFMSFKHSAEAPETHSFPGSGSRFCLVKAMIAFLNYRGKSSGPLFTLHGVKLSPITNFLLY